MITIPILQPKYTSTIRRRTSRPFVESSYALGLLNFISNFQKFNVIKDEKVTTDDKNDNIFKKELVK